MRAGRARRHLGWVCCPCCRPQRGRSVLQPPIRRSPREGPGSNPGSCRFVTCQYLPSDQRRLRKAERRGCSATHTTAATSLLLSSVHPDLHATALRLPSSMSPRHPALWRVEKSPRDTLQGTTRPESFPACATLSQPCGEAGATAARTTSESRSSSVED